MFKDPWLSVLSLPERFVGDRASLARDKKYTLNSVSGTGVVLARSRFLDLDGST